MHPSQTNAARQRRRVLSGAENTDAFGFFNLLTGPQLLDDVEELLPDHRERLFPPTETLAHGAGALGGRELPAGEKGPGSIMFFSVCRT